MISLFAGIVGVLVIVVLARPFFGPGDSHAFFDSRQPVSRRKALREEKARLLAAMRELDFDYQTQKLSASDYQVLRSRYQSQAAHVLQELAILEKEWKEFEEEVSWEVNRRMGALPVTPSCPACGGPVGAAHRYCQHCGKELAPSASPRSSP